MAVSPAFELLKVAEADFPSRFGHFRIFGFEGRYATGAGRGGRTAAWRHAGDAAAGPDPFRMSDRRCIPQLTMRLPGSTRACALYRVGEEGRGLIIYEHQEGRGIGLMNKLRAYELQDFGADTVEANEQLGFKADHREYQLPGSILKLFRYPAGSIAVEQPRQDQCPRTGRYPVVERVPCQVEPIATTEDYLRTKKEKFGHLL